MRYPVSDAFGLFQGAGLGQGLLELYNKEQAAFRQRYEPPPSTHGFAPPRPSTPPSDLPQGLSSEQTNSLCRLVELYNDAGDPDGEIKDVLTQWMSGLDQADRERISRYVNKNCFRPQGLMSNIVNPLVFRPTQHPPRPLPTLGPPVPSVDSFTGTSLRSFPTMGPSMAPQSFPSLSPGMPVPTVDFRSTGVQMPSMQPSSGAMAPTSMTPTSGSRSGPCPPGQFRPAPGALCRGSVGAMPGLPGGLTQGGWGGMPVAAPYLSGGRITREGFGQSIWT